ncbi:hypothetical protein O4159_21555 [Gordonia terrae]|nr:hypothetical protein [Gordonia terrae]
MSDLGHLPPPAPPSWYVVDQTWMWSTFVTVWPFFAVGAVVLFAFHIRRGVVVPEKTIRVCLATAVGLAIFSLGHMVLLGAGRGDFDVWGRGFGWAAAVLGAVAGVSLMVAAVSGFVAVAVVGWQRDTHPAATGGEQPCTDGPHTEDGSDTPMHVSSGDQVDPP